MSDESPLAVTVSAMNTEYTAIRGEMQVAAEHQRAVIQLSVTIFAGVLTLVGIGVQAKGGTRNGIGDVLLLVPFSYIVLALTTADAGRRIVMMASYLHNDLRKRLETELDGAKIWRWENFVNSYVGGLPRATRWTVIFIDKARWLIFILPSAIAMIAAWLILANLNTVQAIIFVADIVLLLIVFALLTIIDRTTGKRSLPAARHGQRSSWQWSDTAARRWLGNKARPGVARSSRRPSDNPR